MRGKDWPNLWRMFVALCLLLISPLMGIAVGALFWGSLERGLLVFNLLGLGGFALASRPFWRGNRKRVRGLLRSALAMGISSLLDILSGRPVPLAVYFSSMVECFSLIPWITEILGELHKGQWRETPVFTAAGHPASNLRKQTPSLRPEPVNEGPELPLPKFPWWGVLLLVLLLILTGILLASVFGSPQPTTLPFRKEHSL